MATGFPVKPYEIVDPAWLNAIGARLIGDSGNLSGVASASFTSIPATFSHLLVLWHARSSGAGASVWMRYNNISTATYYYNVMQATGATPNCTAVLAVAGISLGSAPGTGAASANDAAAGMALIPFYSAPADFPQHIGHAVYWSGTATGSGRPYTISGNYQGGAIVPSRLDFLFSDASNFVSGSRFSLYGMP